MGLINLQTDLKSLKFGKDRPGGGSSKQPYIQKPISDNPQGNTGGTDFILRGGLNAPQRALEDVARLTKYIADGSKGILYTAKENLLSRMSVGTEASRGPAYAMGALNAGVYTPLSTLAQAGVGFAGTHLNKMGIDPTGLLPGLRLNKYETVVERRNKEKRNSLEIVKGKETIIPLPNGTFIPVSLPDKLKGKVSNRLLEIYKDKQFSKKILFTNTIYRYGGGPGSLLGIGGTRIKFADQRTGQNNKDLFKSEFFSKGFSVFKHTDSKTRTFDRIDYRNYLGASNKQGLSLEKNGINNSGLLSNLFGNPDRIFDIFSFENFKNKKPDTDLNKKIFEKESKNPHLPIKKEEFKTYENTTLAKLYEGNTSFKTGINIENRVNLGDPGATKGSYTEPLDKVNGSFLYKSKEGYSGVDKGGIYNDLISFRIGIINSNSPIDPLSKEESALTYMNFRSYIDSFSDSYSSDWKAQSYMGRGEKFYKYGGFDRSISLSFTVVAQSMGEMRGMYQKLNYLASSLAPTYTTNGYMAGNLVKMTVGNYIYEQYGFISSITYDIPQESSWDLSLNPQNSEISRDDLNPDELPYMIKVTGLKFTPIHNFRPEINTYNNAGTAKLEKRFITEQIPFTPNHNNY